jgi:hypothetical protein
MAAGRFEAIRGKSGRHAEFSFRAKHVASPSDSLIALNIPRSIWTFSVQLDLLAHNHVKPKISACFNAMLLHSSKSRIARSGQASRMPRRNGLLRSSEMSMPAETTRN